MIAALVVAIIVGISAPLVAAHIVVHIPINFFVVICFSVVAPDKKMSFQFLFFLHFSKMRPNSLSLSLSVGDTKVSTHQVINMSNHLWLLPAKCFIDPALMENVASS